MAEKTKADDASAEPVIAPVMVSMTTEQLQALIVGAKGASGLTGDDLKAILASQAAIAKDTQQALVESTRTVRRSNPDHPHVSAFSHPQGDIKAPKPKLSRETFFNNHRESEEDLTPVEIDAYNAITQSREARDGLWKATIKRNRLFVEVPSYTIDDRSNLPDGLVLILRELAQGERAVTPADMAVRIADLERIVKQQSGGVVLAT